MQLPRPFEVVTPTVDGDVLQVLALAESEFTVGRIHELVGAHSYNGVKKALLRLAGQGIVSSRVVGRATTYQLNRRHLAAPAVVDLAGLQAVFLQRVREHLAGWQHPPVFAALFGSAARGDMRPDSDIDIFVVRAADLADDSDPLSSWDDDLGRLQADVTAWTGNDARVLEMSEDEVRAAVASQDPIIGSIRKEGRSLRGDDSFWRTMNHGQDR